MSRHTADPRADWLRPTRPIARRRGTRPDFLPHVTKPKADDLFWGTLLSMVVGAIFGLMVVLAIAR